MSSKISSTPIILSAGALLFFCMVNQHRPGHFTEGSSAPFCSYQEEQGYNNIQVEESQPSKQWYKYRVEIETTPENQLYKINKSGYNQYEVSRLGESYSYVIYEFTSDKVMTTEEAYEYVLSNPGKCTKVSPSNTQNIYDQFTEDYDNYMDDPEDLLTYPDEVFDFLAD